MMMMMMSQKDKIKGDMNTFARYHACMDGSDGYPLERRHNSKASIEGHDQFVVSTDRDKGGLVTSSDPKSCTSSGSISISTRGAHGSPRRNPNEYALGRQNQTT